jgi:23S rRNA (uracil1939-C5)-methyltransferase
MAIQKELMARKRKKHIDPIEELEITGISSDGRAVGRKDGMVVFVKGGAPGDIVNVDIIGREKNFLIGQISSFSQASEDRIDPVCKHFGTCGGCKWQHITYEAQLAHKAKHVQDNLQKLSTIELPEFQPIQGAPSATYYRNKMEYTFSDSRWLTREEIDEGNELSRTALGFHIPKMFDKILNIEHCHLQEDPSNSIRNALKEFADQEGLSYYNIRNNLGLLRNLIIRITATKEVMVLVQFGANEGADIDKVMKFLDEAFPTITSLLYVINEKKNETFFDLPVVTFSGQSYITEKMGELSFRVGPKSFFQTNSEQAKVLYDRVVEMAALQPDELVYDLYTGTGTIANYVASQVKEVIGIESVVEAVADAKVNAELNNINNTKFYAGDMKELLDDAFIAKHGRPDVIITDPPRAGMHKNVVETMLRIKPKRIIYVSCNPATQARDLELMKDHYIVDKVQPVDMFPQTHHVENIVRLIAK